MLYRVKLLLKCGYSKLNCDVMGNDRAVVENNMFSLGEIKLEMMVPHPGCNVSQACRDPSIDSGSNRLGCH